MSLKESEINKIREELKNSQRPIFLFHDDADGLCSFLLLYRYLKEGKGVVIKSRPYIDEKFSHKVINYEADKVFILDIAVVKQEFIDEVKRKVIWIDHHSPLDLERVDYFNPRIHQDDIIYPVTNICYDIVKQDIWIAMAGCIGDWFLPSFKDEFLKEYPDLFDKDMENPGEILFNSKIGLLVKMINFVLKGSTKDANKCMKVFTRINSPYEILDQTTSRGKFIHARYLKINQEYEELLQQAKKSPKDDMFLIFKYPDNKMSFTGDLSNELLYLHPDKIVIVAREKSGEMRMSLRSSNVNLRQILPKALVGLEGYGGGHEFACGASVKSEQFDTFISNLRNEVSNVEQ